MKKLLRILTVHSVKDLLRYKSFFLLIFLLLLADRIIHRFVKTPDKNFVLPHGMAFSHQTADYLFGQLPQKLVQWLFTPRIIAIAAGLFLLKQVISLWPSSDMRRMHRKERGRFGVFEALLALRWYQMAWDALAVGSGLSWLFCWGCRSGPMLWLSRACSQPPAWLYRPCRWPWPGSVILPNWP
jgi:hypothetical protein